jgi:DNA-binding transcriptional ArsR family regulator
LSNDSTAKEILFVLSDETCLKIMKLLDNKELNAQIISSTLSIPLSSTYRKIRKLEQLKIIKKTKVIRTLDGLDESFYTLSMKEITITYRNHSFKFNIQQKKLEDRIVRLWQKFKD